MDLKGKSIEGFPLVFYNGYIRYELGGMKSVGVRNKRSIKSIWWKR